MDSSAKRFQKDRANNRRCRAGSGFSLRHQPSDLLKRYENLHRTVIKYWINIIVLITSHIWKWKAICGVGNDKINKFVRQTLSALRLHLGGEFPEFVFLSSPFPAQQRNDDFMRMLWVGGKSIFTLKWRAFDALCVCGGKFDYAMRNFPFIRFRNYLHANYFNYSWKFLFTCETIEGRLLHENLLSFYINHDAERQHHDD